MPCADKPETMSVSVPRHSAELPYRVWAALAPSLVEARQQWSKVSQLLAPHADAVVFSWWFVAYGRRRLGHIFLWSGEATAYHALLRSPYRQVTCRLRPEPKPHIEMVPVRIGDHIGDAAFLDALCRRLASIAPYDPPWIPDFPDWLWHMHGHEHWNFLADDKGLVMPPGWTRRGSRLGPIFCRTTHLRLIDGRGRMGLMAEDGRIALPCRYAYLSDPDCRTMVACEASEPTMPETLGACDIIDTQGRRTNPCGIKVLAGTLMNGRAVAVSDDENGERRMGYIASDGRPLGDIRWREVTQHWRSAAKVQDAATGLWGFVDSDGQVIIFPRFLEASMLSQGYAVVRPAFPDGAALGVIDKTGRLVVPAVWSDIQRLKGDAFMVTTADGASGAVDLEGRILIEPRTLTAVELAQIEEGNSLCRNHPFNRELAERLRKRVTVALCGSAGLAPLAGLFGRSTDEQDLMNVGLWGERVVVTEDCIIHGRIALAAGDTGTIGWHYPVSGSIFELGKEAPVEGLSVLPQASIGVPWRLLRRVP